MSVEDATWSEVLRLWTQSSETPSQIGRRFGLSHQLIVAQARKRSWPARPNLGSTRNASVIKRRKKKSVREKSACHDPKGLSRQKAQPLVVDDELLKRVYEAIEKIVGAIEERMTGDHLETIADTERLVRTLGSLIQNIGKIHDVDDQFQRQRHRGKAKAATARDAERRREALAVRVFKILSERSEASSG